MTQPINSNETLIEGQWLLNGQNIAEDENCKRIDWLVQNTLTKITHDESGWEILYQDKIDGRLWVHYYRNSEMQGGGPPALKLITKSQAEAIFNVRHT
jgi:hypothetical protein